MTTEISKNKVPEAINSLDSKLKALNAIQDKASKTNGQFFFNGIETTNIEDETDIRKLIQVFAFIQEKSEQYSKAAESLLPGVAYPVFKWQDYTFEDWSEDIRKRIAIVAFQKEKSRLETGIAKLKQFLSEEDQVDQIIKEFGLIE